MKGTFLLQINQIAWVQFVACLSCRLVDHLMGCIPQFWSERLPKCAGGDAVSLVLSGFLQGLGLLTRNPGFRGCLPKLAKKEVTPVVELYALFIANSNMGRNTSHWSLWVAV